MSDARHVIEEIRQLNQEQIRAHLEELASEEKALRLLLRTKRAATPKRTAGGAA